MSEFWRGDCPSYLREIRFFSRYHRPNYNNVDKRLSFLYHWPFLTFALDNVVKQSNSLNVCVQSPGYRMDGTKFESRRWQNIIFSKISRPVLVSTQPQIQWLQAFFTGGGGSGGSMNLNTPLHLMPRIKMSGSIHLLPLYVYMPWTGPTSQCVCLCACVCVCE
jgi:hypothetical protein